MSLSGTVPPREARDYPGSVGGENLATGEGRHNTDPNCPPQSTGSATFVRTVAVGDAMVCGPVLPKLNVARKVVASIGLDLSRRW